MIGAQLRFSTYIQQPLLGLQGDTPKLYVQNINVIYLIANASTSQLEGDDEKWALDKRLHSFVPKNFH